MTSTQPPAAAPGEPKTGPRVTVRCPFCGTWNRIDASRASDRPKCGKCAKPLLLDRPIRLDDESFARTIEGSEIPVVVDFYADWCGPCKMMAPFVDELAKKYEGRVLVAKLDTDKAQVTAQKYQIRSIPTVIVFKGGKTVTQQAGAVRLPELESLISRAL